MNDQTTNHSESNNQNNTKTITLSRKDFNSLIESSNRFIKDSYNKYQTATIAAISTSVLLLVTLSWNDVIQSIIKKYYPNGEDTLSGKVKYAIVITFVVLTLQIFLFPYLISREDKNTHK